MIYMQFFNRPKFFQREDGLGYLKLAIKDKIYEVERCLWLVKNGPCGREDSFEKAAVGYLREAQALAAIYESESNALDKEQCGSCLFSHSMCKDGCYNRKRKNFK